MRVGTRSILYGAHQFALHPFFVAAAWWQLFGFPRDPRLWVAFFVHDLGYWGKPNMDGPEGETHPQLGAKIMGRLFGHDWYRFTLLHSRYYSKRLDLPFSRLCVADKLATYLTPWWIYVPLAWLTGEIHEYMGDDRATRYGYQKTAKTRLREWHREVQEYMLAWVTEHRDGRTDTWTGVIGR